ncbi:MAG: DUF2809 domain-containing protein [Flavobacteriaceae bacterium]|nr:DUF2809 domain-containing protein [Flavobacteriaceae bacterium]NNL79214.1 DUF2809 domain-containing protein [Flavobacteriaceae bacterium]
MQFQRKYFKAFLILLIIEIGIATFISGGFIRHSLGDFLAVILLYCLIMSFFKIKPIIVAWIVLIIATFIEVGQFFKVLEVLELQDNRLLNIVFGNTFSYGDLIAYLLGIMTVIIVEFKYRSRL